MSIDSYFGKKKKTKRKRDEEDELEEKLGEPSKKKRKVNSIHSFKELEDTVDPDCSWYEFLRKQFNKPYFQSLKKYIVKRESENKKIYPPVNDVFSAFRYCDLKDIKVVVLGQDPYHQPGQAHGLAFSVRKNVKIPPSLRNIYKELESDISTGKNKFVHPGHGSLKKWAKQGVFLLNNVLTVEDSKAHSHAKQGWETFTSNVIDYINKNCNNLVFMLWGNPAKKKGSKVSKKKHLVISCPHPSPLSARRGFFGSKCFSKCNRYLTIHGKKPIIWKRL